MQSGKKGGSMPSGKRGRRGSSEGNKNSPNSPKVNSKNSGGVRSYSRYNDNAKWHVSEYKPPRRISDEEIAAARKMFFELDRDMSGSIDADELAFMLRSMGQNPTDEEVHALIASVDGADGEESDGKIQLREFIKLYTDGLDSKNRSRKEDVDDVFRAIDARENGTPSARPGSAPVKDAIAKASLSALMNDAYGLDIDVDDLFNSSKSDELSKEDMTAFLLGSEGVSK